MKYCGNCGSEIKDHVQFCGECGMKAGDIQSTGQNSKPPMQNPLKNLSKKQIIVSSIVASVLLLFFIGFKIGENMTSPERAIESFNEAIIEEDAEALSALLYSSDDRLVINEETATYFIDYVKEHPSYLDHLTAQFEHQVETLSAASNQAKAGDLDDIFEQDSSLSLSKVGKTALVFDKHRFEVKPYYINIFTNYPGSTILLNGEKVFTFGENEEVKEYGPILPGQYDIENVFEGEYTTLRAQEQINLLDTNHTPTVRLRLDGHYIDVRSNYSDGELLVNGEATGQSVEETDRIGPVPADGSLSLQVKKDFPWGEVKSESVAVEENNYYNVDLSPVTEELQSTIFDIIESHNKQWIEASKEQDFSKYTHIGDDLASGYKEDVESLQENKVYYYGEGIKEIEYDLNSFSFDTNRNGDYEVRLKVRAANHGDWITTDTDEETKQEINEDSEVEQYEKHYELRYDDDKEKWLIVVSRDLRSFWERISDDTVKRTF